MSFNLNTANKKQLMTIKGIGSVLADRILWWQERVGFNKLIDLMEVKGVKASVFAEVKSQGVYLMDPEEERMDKEERDIVALVRQLTADFILGWSWHGARWSSDRKKKTKQLWMEYSGNDKYFTMALETAQENFSLWRKERSIEAEMEEIKLYDDEAKHLIKEEDLITSKAIMKAYHKFGPAFVLPRLWGTEKMKFEELVDSLFTATEPDNKELQEQLITKATLYYMPLDEALLQLVHKACGSTSPAYSYMYQKARKMGEELYTRAYYEAAEMRLEEAAQQQSESTSKTDNLEELTDGLDGDKPEHNEYLDGQLEGFYHEPNWMHIYRMIARRDRFIENYKQFMRELCHVERSKETRTYREDVARHLRTANNYVWDIFMRHEVRNELKLEGNALGWLTKNQLAEMSMNIVTMFKVLVPHWSYAPKPIKKWEDHMRENGQGAEAKKRMDERAEHDEKVKAEHQRYKEASRGDMGKLDDNGDWHQTEISYTDEGFNEVDLFVDAEF